MPLESCTGCQGASKSSRDPKTVDCSPGVGKRLAYDGGGGGGESALPTAASGMQHPDLAADLAALLELPDPDDASSTSAVSASAADATNASADSTVTQVQVRLTPRAPDS